MFYEGDWVNNKQEGQGTLTFNNGNVYKGEFRNNNPHGNGSMTTVNGQTVQGHWGVGVIAQPS